MARFFGAAAALLVVLLPVAPSGHATDWTSLFDGKTLDGWHVAAKPEDRDKGFWQVRDGAITCDSRGRKNHNYVWLVREGVYADFELRLKVRGFRESTGNSGVQVRSRYDEAAFRMNGPQADVHPPTPWRTGLIYDETMETRRWIFPSMKDHKIDASSGPKDWKWNEDGWNTLWIRCAGTKIQTRVNDLPVADFEGDGVLNDEAHRGHDVGMRGNIALQLHVNDDLLIQYKDIEIKVLP
jgi:hypothetical protein